MRVETFELPQDTLLQSYAQRADCYTDCYSAVVTGTVDLEQFLNVFYKTPLFRSERLILSSVFKSPSSDADLAAMARGEAETFAAWRVEGREAAEILLCDRSGRTRSWLKVESEIGKTRLLFGSAVTPKYPGDGLGWLFKALLPFHKVYARSLLKAAARAL